MKSCSFPTASETATGTAGTRTGLPGRDCSRHFVARVPWSNQVWTNFTTPFPSASPILHRVFDLQFLPIDPTSESSGYSRVSADERRSTRLAAGHAAAAAAAALKQDGRPDRTRRAAAPESVIQWSHDSQEISPPTQTAGIMQRKTRGHTSKGEIATDKDAQRM